MLKLLAGMRRNTIVIIIMMIIAIIINIGGNMSYNFKTLMKWTFS